VVAADDVVIATALVPGRRAPILLTAEMVNGMAPGSVVVDLAADKGGNCELTKPGETIVVNGVTIIGPTNVPSAIPTHGPRLTRAGRRGPADLAPVR
jgi:NAD(P) transhydrogenase subunit alpha